MKLANPSSAAQLKLRAQKVMKKRSDGIIATFLLVVLMSAAALFVALMFSTDEYVATILLGLVSLLFISPLIFGFYRYTLKMFKTGRRVPLSEIWYAFKKCYSKSIGVAIVLNFAVAIPSAISGTVFSIILLILDESLALSATVYNLLSVLFSLASTVICLPIYLKYIMAPFILLEHPKLSVAEIASRSKAMMMGNRWRFFCLNLSFIGWFIVSVFTFGLGYFYTVPYMYVSYAAFYREVSKESRTPVGFVKGLFRRK